MTLSNQEATDLMNECLRAYHESDPDFQGLMDDATMQLTEEQWEQLQELLRPFTSSEALEYLANGHTILSVLTTRRVCDALELPFPEVLVMRWKNREEALRAYGFFSMGNQPGEGVDSLALSYYVVGQLGIDPAPGRAYTGKGFQAQANSHAIAQELSRLGRI